MDAKLELMFPVPTYNVKKESDLDLSEKKDIEDIIEEGIRFDSGHSFSNNSYIFNTKLKKLKEFCEYHIKIYVEKIISPREELDFYITQSWLNITKPGEIHQIHAHSNSIISGAFYIKTDADQRLTFYDQNKKFKQTIKINPKKATIWNSEAWEFKVTNNQLLLFPAWIDHGVKVNEKQTKDVISLSFNTFVKGTIGDELEYSNLVL